MSFLTGLFFGVIGIGVMIVGIYIYRTVNVYFEQKDYEDSLK